MSSQPVSSLGRDPHRHHQLAGLPAGVPDAVGEEEVVHRDGSLALGAPEAGGGPHGGEGLCGPDHQGAIVLLPEALHVRQLREGHYVMWDEEPVVPVKRKVRLRARTSHGRARGRLMGTHAQSPSQTTPPEPGPSKGGTSEGRLIRCNPTTICGASPPHVAAALCASRTPRSRGNRSIPGRIDEIRPLAALAQQGMWSLSSLGPAR